MNEWEENVNVFSVCSTLQSVSKNYSQQELKQSSNH